MYKFFINTNQIINNSINIIGEDVNHIKNVLRKKEDDLIEVCNKDTSKSYVVKINKINDQNIECIIIEEIKSTTEPNVYIHVFQGLPKSDKMELIIQKSVELGAAEITPILTRRSIVKLDSKAKIKKVQRWQKISEVAAKQSKRDIIPPINNIINIENICNICSEYDIVLIAYEEEHINTIKLELKKLQENIQKKDFKIAIIIGPEGGLEKEEVEILINQGAKTVTLGKRILRTETAALNLISVIIYELEF